MVRIKIEKSTRKNKKYKAIISEKNKRDRTVHFGDSRYPQYKDTTGIGAFTSKNLLDEKRRKNYFPRHGKVAKKYSAKFFSHKYLWSK